MPITAADPDKDPAALKITTERLILRRVLPEDRAELALALNDWQVVEWLSRVPFPYTLNDADDWIAIAARDALLGTMTALSVMARDDNRLIGSVGLIYNSDVEAELGYWLRRDCWGRGLGREMVAAMVDYGFENMGLTGQIAAARPDNQRSIQLLEAVGFRSIGERVYIRPPLDGALSGPHWYLTRQDWHQKHETKHG